MTLTNLEKADNERSILLHSIQPIEQRIQGHLVNKISKEQCQVYIEELKEMKEKNHDIQIRIANTRPVDMDPYTNAFLDLSKRVSNAQSSLIRIIKEQTTPPPTPSKAHDDSQSNVYDCGRPPPIDIPTFKGSYEEWPAFMGLFESIIHQSNYSDVAKLAYLKKYVLGDAAVLIKNFTTTGNNYTEAWELLKNRFDNKREIVNAQLRRLFSIASVKQATAANIQALLDQTNQCIRALKGLEQPTNKWDAIIVFMTVDKLDSETKRHWALTLSSTALPTYDQLSVFLEQHIRSLHAMQTPLVKPHHHFEKRGSHFSHAKGATTHGNCVLCEVVHPLTKCAKFLAMSSQERSGIASRNKLCYNCLRPSSSNHNAETCKAGACRTCQKKHHTLLHFNRAQAQGQSANQPYPNATATSSNHLSDCSNNTDILLSTAIVYIPDHIGELHQARIMLDSGSQANLVGEQLVQKFGLRRRWDRTRVTGIGGTEAGFTKGKVELTLISKIYSESLTIEALVLPKVTNELPSLPCVNNYNHIAGIKLADPYYYKPGPIDIILGAEYTSLIQREGKILQDSMSPVAINTMFGWVLSGRVCVKQSNQMRVQTNICETDALLAKYFALESVQTPKHLTDEEKVCEEHFLNNYRRAPDGRFCVKLPFNKKIKDLGFSKGMAIKRWKSVERRLAKNPQFAVEYSNFMKEYLDLGHMQYIPTGEADSCDKYYVPHHFVLKLDSSTTKFRVVFDASAKTSSGLSLNDCLHVGATLQDDIFSLLLRFRQRKIAVKADITKMFRQFLVDEKDCDYQRIVWRAKPTDLIEEYKLLTITYGQAASPFLATRCLIELAECNKAQFPSTSKKLSKDTYVDDLMSGADTVVEAKQLVCELNKIAGQAKLTFRKWSSNNLDALEDIPEDDRELKAPQRFDCENNVKALGIQWNATTDTFSFTRPEFETSELTKRSVLSQLAKVFDPLGLLAPITINAKLFMQSLWKSEIHWDEKLTVELCNRWIAYQEQLKNIEDIHIPRYVRVSGAVTFELHGFSDASEKAYGAVVFMRCRLQNNDYVVQMLTSKSRVAPLKTVSLPRLELCGALLLAELIESVKNSLCLECKVELWTDSMIVLQWLASHPGKWQTFVANRVSKIQEIVPFSQWNHVRSEDNPADLVSRGLTATGLQDSSLWWNGPSWLQTNNLPEKVVVPKTTTLQHEERKKPIFISLVELDVGFLNNFSSLIRLKRVVGYILRFKTNCLSKIKNTDALSAGELQDALMKVVCAVQQHSFKGEYELLKLNPIAKVTGRLSSLNPFIDDKGLLRVGGRIQESSVNFEAKHPIILPHDNNLTKLIIWNSHMTHGHAGNKLVWCNLRQNWWVINARNTIRYELRKCVKCRRFRAKTMEQIMSNLPSSRLHPGRAFLDTGVDYAGPFHISSKTGRAPKITKGYMCLFVCMSTKALHLEAVTDMTTDAFIAALNRFVSRRGYPRTMHSDCGTNFIGADRELQKMIRSDSHNRQITDHLSVSNIEWLYNPPSAPHHGGLWEAAVKSAKNHFKKVVGEQKLTFEEFTTVLCQIEACLNSRPICALTADPDDVNVLTPGHFLIGQPLTSIPTADITHLKINRLSRWQLTQQMVQHFWKRWQLEYLSTLQQRWKWKNKGRNIEVGDLCVLLDEHQPPTKWKLVRVVETYPGQDGQIRTVTIKTGDGLLKRPITKLSPILFVEEL